MSTASELEEAKNAIVSSDEQDPELNSTLKAAQTERLDAIKEANRHREATAKIRQGLFGFLGSKENAPNNIAAIAVLFGFAGFVICLIAGAQAQDTAVEHWSRNSERSLAVALTALAYLFGRGSSPQ